MKLGQVAAITDPGRKRRRNEDVYVCEPPVFAIADGMGGAQAGEVASRLAAAAVREDAGSDAGPEEHVTALIHEANRRVYTRSSEDAAVSGMGTTITLAYVHGGGVTIGHVGDSRAYLIRGGKLEQVTDDHSLVSELVRSGKLSPQEAESHPQRSVITRVLGTEPDVDVDTFSLAAEPGDVFLLCSDGLTSMVDDATILETLDRTGPVLEAALKELVRAANRAGGEDNITIVCFEIAGPAASAGRSAGSEGHMLPADDETLTEADGVPVVEDVPGWNEDDWQSLEPGPARSESRRLSRRAWVALATVIALLALAAGLGLLALSRAHFVGAEKDGHVAVYQGVPWNLIGSLRLYRVVDVSALRTAQLSQAERRRLFDHDLTSEATARAKIERYLRELPGLP